MAETRKLGVLFIPRFADREYGLLAASTVEWCGAQAFSPTPDGQPVASTAGFPSCPIAARPRAKEHADNS